MTWHTVERAVFDNNGEWCTDMYGSGYVTKGDKLYVNVLLGGGASETRYVCTKLEFIKERNRMLHVAFYGDAKRDAEVAKKAFVAGFNEGKIKRPVVDLRSVTGLAEQYANQLYNEDKDGD